MGRAAAAVPPPALKTDGGRQQLEAEVTAWQKRAAAIELILENAEAPRPGRPWRGPGHDPRFWQSAEIVIIVIMTIHPVHWSPSHPGALMTRTLSVAQAKARFSAAIRDAEEGRPVVITRHGDPVAALVRVEDLRALERLRAAGPKGGLASVAGGWEGSDELVERILCARRRGSRTVPAGE